MNIIVQNRRNVEFDLADLEVQVKDFVEDNNVVYYLIEVRLLAQIWILKKRFSDFDKMHARLKADLEFKAAENLPDLPPKKLFFNKNPQFLRDRMRALNRFIKLVILIYEAIENPILQRFLEIDTNFNPNYEYETIDVGVVDDSSEVSSLFLEGDKLSKVKKLFQEQKEGRGKRGTKQEEQEQYLLSQFSVKDLPNHRFYNPMIDAPISEDMEYDSDYLDEYHGRDAENYLMDFDIDLDDISAGGGGNYDPMFMHQQQQQQQQQQYQHQQQQQLQMYNQPYQNYQSMIHSTHNQQQQHPLFNEMMMHNNHNISSIQVANNYNALGLSGQITQNTINMDLVGGGADHTNNQLHYSPSEIPMQQQQQQRMIQMREEFKTADAKKNTMNNISPLNNNNNNQNIIGNMKQGMGDDKFFLQEDHDDGDNNDILQNIQKTFNNKTTVKEESKRGGGGIINDDKTGGRPSETLNINLRSNLDGDDDEDLPLRIGTNKTNNNNNNSMREVNRVASQVDSLLQSYKNQQSNTQIGTADQQQKQTLQQQQQQHMRQKSSQKDIAQKQPPMHVAAVKKQDSDFHVNDEYEQIDENQCDDINKILVKKASKACNKLIKENSELFRLNYKINEMSQELDEADLYYNDLRSKIIERCQLIKKIMANPTKLHKIKKNQLVNAIQQEIDNDALNVVDDQPFFMEDVYNDPYYQNHGSLPSMSTGMFMGSTVQNKLAAVNRKQNEVNKFI